MKPKKIISPAAWNAKELSENPNWIYHLSDNELAELNTCLEKCRDIPTEDITRDTFPLHVLRKAIETQFSGQLEKGIGTLLIKGIDASQYSKHDLAKLLWGIGLYFGEAVSQSVAGERLHEVKDDGYDLQDPRARGTDTKAKLPFHSDPCDVAVLMGVYEAKSGGESQIVSSVAIHNAMLANYPTLLAHLYEPYYSMPLKVFSTQPRLYHKPIFAVEQGNFICNILRRVIDSAQALPDVPKMTAEQIESLDVFETLAESKALCHTFTLEPGDIWFSNGFVTLHSRTSFADYEDTDKKRLLFRLWLSTQNSRPLPESFRGVYHNIGAGEIRGGILPRELSDGGSLDDSEKV